MMGSITDVMERVSALANVPDQMGVGPSKSLMVHGYALPFPHGYYTLDMREQGPKQE